MEENGIYAVLAKFTGVLYVVSQIFLQTWQQNAIEQYNSRDRDKIFSAVFNCYFYLFCGLVVFFPFVLRINYGWLVGREYSASSQYLFLNSLYMMCFAMSMFFDLGYQCAKQTHRSLPGIVIATCVNLAGNYFLIGIFGLNGVIISGIITFLVLAVYRMADTRKYMKITFDSRNMSGVILVAISGVAYAFSGHMEWDLCCIAVFSLIYVAVAPSVFKQNVISRFFSVL